MSRYFEGVDARIRAAAWKGLPFLVALVVTGLITAASYPGFMSFDSIEALRQARGGVEGSQYPPFGSYVWRIFDWIWPGPTLMQLLQNGLLLMTLAAIFRALRWPVLLQASALIAFAILPPVMGVMLVVWKDVAVAAFYLASVYLLVIASLRPADQRGLLVAGAVVVLFFGMAYRFNAASGALPMAVFAVWLMSEGRGIWTRRLTGLVGGFLLLLGLFAMVWFVNSYRFPSLERLERNTNMDSIMRFDLVGISKFSGQSTMSDRQGMPIPASYLAHIYDPRHLNITSLNDVRRLLPVEMDNIGSQWISAIRENPMAYIHHRSAVMQEYVGLHGHEIFYVTHPSVDDNALGIRHEPNALTRRAVGHVWEHRASWIERAWVYYLMAAMMLIIMFLSGVRLYRTEAVLVIFSGLLYLAPMSFITPAGDLRYNFWSIVACLVGMAFSTTGLVTHYGRRSTRIDLT